MNLIYRILCFDDQAEWFEAIEDELKVRLEELGFKLQAELVATRIASDDDLHDKIKAFDPDLLLVDFQLDDGELGDALMKRIRLAFKFTEIVFYSQNTAASLRRKVADADVDGVYCANRDTLAEQAMGVIKTTIRKVIDINHMRGIVVASVADLDHLVEECLRAVLAATPEPSAQGMIDKAVVRLKEAADADSKEAGAFLTPGRSVDDLLSNKWTSGRRKSDRLAKWLRQHDGLRDRAATVRAYGEHILEERNVLAHAKEERLNGETVLRGWGKKKDRTFNADELAKLRQQLLETEANFEEILRRLNGLAEC